MTVNSGDPNKTGGAMISISAKRTLVVVACLAATASLSSCGGDDGPDLPPKPTATDEASGSTGASTLSDSTPTPTSSATSSAPPGEADLDRAQESAYAKAVQNFDAANKLIFAMYANPQPNPATADQIKSVSYNPFSERVFVEIQRYKRAGVRLEGQPTVKWRRPVSVELDGRPRPSVVWEQCASLSSVRVLKGDRELAQDPAFKRVRITQNGDASGRWLVSDNTDAGSCD